MARSRAAVPGGTFNSLLKLLELNTKTNKYEVKLPPILSKLPQTTETGGLYYRLARLQVIKTIGGEFLTERTIRGSVRRLFAVEDGKLTISNHEFAKKLKAQASASFAIRTHILYTIENGELFIPSEVQATKKNSLLSHVKDKIPELTYRKWNDGYFLQLNGKKITESNLEDLKVLFLTRCNITLTTDPNKITNNYVRTFSGKYKSSGEPSKRRRSSALKNKPPKKVKREEDQSPPPTVAEVECSPTPEDQPMTAAADVVAVAATVPAFTAAVAASAAFAAVPAASEPVDEIAAAVAASSTAAAASVAYAAASASDDENQPMLSVETNTSANPIELADDEIAPALSAAAHAASPGDQFMFVEPDSAAALRAYSSFAVERRSPSPDLDPVSYLRNYLSRV